MTRPVSAAPLDLTVCRVHRTALSLSLVGVPFCPACRRELSTPEPYRTITIPKDVTEWLG